jgi:hypothetical protein
LVINQAYRNDNNEFNYADTGSCMSGRLLFPIAQRKFKLKNTAGCIKALVQTGEIAFG